jgi:proteasome accessory factor C
VAAHDGGALMPPVAATEQVRRLLVMIPWLTSRKRVPLSEVARAFGISVAQAEKDVLLAGMIGVPPYTGGFVVEITLDEDEGYVEAFPQPYLTRPPKLTAAQGFALLASAQGLLDYRPERGGGPLGTAMEKLANALGDPNVVDIDLQRPSNLDEVRRAVETGAQLHIEYYAAWRDEVNERDIDPHVVFQRNGRWYVEAWCHRRNDKRRFRIDRIRSLAPTGVTFEPVRAEPPSEVWDPGADAQRVVLDLPASARWVVESYPVEWTEADGRLRVTMHVLGTAWLERLLLRVGADARVVEPAAMVDVGRDAAARLLTEYGEA